jgi:hypothetical protein
MIKKILIVAILFTVILGCKKSTEAEPEKNPLVGTWVLELITDELDNYVGNSQGIDGVIVRMDLNDDGTGQAFILNGTQAITYSSTWSATDDQFVIDIDGRGELTHQYDIMSSGKQAKDEGPSAVSLVLSGSNQFAGYLDVSLIFYYVKT